MSLLVASLYLLCLAFLFGSALYVLSLDPFARLNTAYTVLALSLLAWVGTLFVFQSEGNGAELLLLGRINFAAAALMVPAVYGFVIALRQEPVTHSRRIWTEAAILALLCIVTPFIDRSERVVGTLHLTSYGVLFPLYLLHIGGFVVVSLWQAFRPALGLRPLSRQQLRLIGIGILITASVAIITNAVLPYLFSDFRWIDWGTLATIFFLSAVAYAISVQHLFNVQIVVRLTVVFGILIAFAIEIYQLAVEFLTKLLPLGDPTERHIAAASIALIVNAFTHESVKAMLDKVVDRIGMQRKHTADKPTHRRK